MSAAREPGGKTKASAASAANARGPGFTGRLAALRAAARIQRESGQARSLDCPPRYALSGLIGTWGGPACSLGYPPRYALSGLIRTWGGPACSWHAEKLAQARDALVETRVGRGEAPAHEAFPLRAERAPRCEPELRFLHQ